MKFQVVSLFPEMILSGLKEGVVSSSIDKKIIQIECSNPRKFTDDNHHTVDDRPFGGGDGMLMLAEPVQQSIDYFERHAEAPHQLIYLSARGERFTDQVARELAGQKTLTLICGRYGGVDQRVLSKNRVREISVGDYVLSGGELAALVLIDAVARLLPGVLGNSESADKDSFSDGLLEAPQFTRGREWGGLEVPAVLLSGDHKKIKEWQSFLSLYVSIQNREDLVFKKSFAPKFLKAAQEYFTKMSEGEKFVCGILDSSKISKFLTESLK